MASKHALLLAAVVVFHQPWGTVAEEATTDAERDALCAKFERIGESAWRTESGASVAAFKFDEPMVMHVPPSDITPTAASDLFYTLEGTCPHNEPTG